MRDKTPAEQTVVEHPQWSEAALSFLILSLYPVHLRQASLPQDSRHPGALLEPTREALVDLTPQHWPLAQIRQNIYFTWEENRILGPVHGWITLIHTGRRLGGCTAIRHSRVCKMDGRTSCCFLGRTYCLRHHQSHSRLLVKVNFTHQMRSLPILIPLHQGFYSVWTELSLPLDNF